MFQRFYEDCTPEQAKQFGVEIGKLGREVSPAHIQGHLLLHKERKDDAIENIGTLCK
jgi:hypothetical protein